MDINLLAVKSQHQEKSAIFPDSERILGDSDFVTSILPEGQPSDGYFRAGPKSSGS